MNEILTRSGDVETSINPDDTRSSSQGKKETSGNTLCTVGMEKFKMNSMTGETKYNQNPSFMLNFSMKCKDWTKDVSLSLSKWRLDGLRMSGTSASKAVKIFLTSLRQARYDFFKSMTSFLTPVM